MAVGMAGMPGGGVGGGAISISMGVLSGLVGILFVRLPLGGMSWVGFGVSIGCEEEEGGTDGAEVSAAAAAASSILISFSRAEAQPSASLDITLNSCCGIPAVRRYIKS